MTRQIERAYKSNRRRSWLLIAAVVAVAAVIIPIASGAADKNYTLLFPATGATSPAAKVSTSGNQTLCAGNTYTVSLTLSNTAKTVSLGSANITFPPNVTISAPLSLASASTGYTIPASATAKSTLSSPTNTVSLRELSMPKGKQLTLTVSLAASATATAASNFSASVKQANDFNDTSGGANTFDNPSMPTITVATCVGTISGKVWNDQNENKTRDAAFEVAQNTWFVRLYKKVNGVYGSTPVRTIQTPFGSDGSYTFEDVPLNSDYLVCEQPSSTDAIKEWHQTTDTNNSACRVLNTSNEKNGWEIAPFAASVSGRDFGNARSTTVPRCGGSADSNPSFTVVGGAGGNCKAVGPSSAEYVYEKWTDTGIQYAAFHPVSGDGVCVLTGPAGSCTYFVQKMTWTLTTDLQPGSTTPTRVLKYDDRKNASGLYELEAMKYCKKDPRAVTSGDGLVLAALDTPAQVAADVLPSGTRTIDGDAQSSCLIKSTESTTTGGTISRVDLVFTAVDGRSAMG